MRVGKGGVGEGCRARMFTGIELKQTFHESCTI